MGKLYFLIYEVSHLWVHPIVTLNKKTYIPACFLLSFFSFAGGHWMLHSPPWGVADSGRSVWISCDGLLLIESVPWLCNKVSSNMGSPNDAQLDGNLTNHQIFGATNFWTNHQLRPKPIWYPNSIGESDGNKALVSAPETFWIPEPPTQNIRERWRLSWLVLWPQCLHNLYIETKTSTLT